MPQSKSKSLRPRATGSRPRRPVAPRADTALPVDIGVMAEILGYRLRRVHAHLSQRSAAALAQRQLKPGELSALSIISATPGISQVALARELGVDKAAIVTIIDDLERWGWAVRRQSADDRRRNSMQATAKGEKALAELIAIVKANETKVTGVLAPAELARLFALLDRIYGACRAPT